MPCASRVRAMAYHSRPEGTLRLTPNCEPPIEPQPCTSIQPYSFILPADQPLEPIVDCHDRMALVDCHPHGGAHGRVHAGRRSAIGQDCQPQPADIWRRWVGQRPDQGAQDAELFLETAAAQIHGLFIIACGYRFGHGARLLHAFHQRQVGNPVVAHADQLRFSLGIGIQQLFHRGLADQRAHPAVEGAWRAAALDVPQDRHPGIFTQPLLQHFAHLLAGNWVSVAVAGAFGNHHHAVAAAGRPPCSQHIAHQRFPVVRFRRAFGDEHPMRRPGQAAHQGQVAAVASHHFDHKSALVTGCRAANLVERIGNALERCIGANGHIGAGKVIVDRADQANNRQVRMLRCDFLGDLTRRGQFGDQAGPLLAKEIGAGQAAVPANDHQAVDAPRSSGSWLPLAFLRACENQRSARSRSSFRRAA